jgi:ADP-ribosylglycohydrolase
MPVDMGVCFARLGHEPVHETQERNLMPMDEALISLEGLSVGDAFGENFFALPPEFLLTRTLPPSPWPWTDDTHMALSIVEILERSGRIDQDALAGAFARRFRSDPFRGYGEGAARLLRRISLGEDWREAAPSIFAGGSYGNGAAMRAAPIGGYFKGDPSRAAAEALLSAEVTHSHPEGRAGAMAVAAAAAIAADSRHPVGERFLREILGLVTAGVTRNRIELSIDIPKDAHMEAVERLGTGVDISAQDTVPYCLWCAAHCLHDFEEALWWTAGGLGDCDTTCAIVGGIVALSASVPPSWIERREPLPGR